MLSRRNFSSELFLNRPVPHNLSSTSNLIALSSQRTMLNFSVTQCLLIDFGSMGGLCLGLDEFQETRCLFRKKNNAGQRVTNEMSFQKVARNDIPSSMCKACQTFEEAPELKIPQLPESKSVKMPDENVVERLMHVSRATASPKSSSHVPSGFENVSDLTSPLPSSLRPLSSPPPSSPSRPRP